jgi:ribosomal protein L7/L12
MPKCARCKNVVAPDAERCPQCGAWLSQLADGPEPNNDSLEDTIRLLLNQDRKIAAIKLFREHAGLGLAEAKAAVERIERGESPPARENVADDLEQQVLELMAAGKKIAAIKLYREQSGSGLKDAKDAVEALAARHGIATPVRSGCFGVFAMLISAASLAAVVCLMLLGR